MKRAIFISVSILFGAMSHAQTELPHHLSNGETADADAVMGNLTTLAGAIDANADAISTLKTPPSTCEQEQIIKWDGSKWVCSDSSPAMGTGTSAAASGGRNADFCFIGEIKLTAGVVAIGVPAQGQLLQISQNQALFSLLGTQYGGDGRTTFALPDMRPYAPPGLTYAICTQGVYPSRD